MRNVSFMIMGDAHLDSAFERDCAVKRAEQRTAFDTAMGLAVKYNIDYLLIPGDLFDKRSPDPETVEYVKNSFRKLERTKVVIAPGSHDPCTVDSPYYKQEWPENVYSFRNGRCEFLEFSLGGGAGGDRDYLYNTGNSPVKRGLRIYGAAFESHFSRSSLLLTQDGKPPRLSSAYLNLLVMYGELDPEGGKSLYNPLSGSALFDCGFDFCAIGGNHGSFSRSGICSSGVLYPRGFEEQGDTGVVVGEITEEGRVLSEFIPINTRKFEHVNFDVTGLDDFSAISLADGIKQITKREICHDITLIGEIGFEETVDAAGLENWLTGYYPEVRVTDKTVKKADVRLLAGEKTLRGIAIRKTWEKIKKQRDGEEGKKEDFDEKIFDEAVNICLKGFED